MIDDSGARLLVTDDVTFGGSPDRVLPWNSVDFAVTHAFPSRAEPSHVAYVIYTSGSTGVDRRASSSHTARRQFRR